MGGPQSPDENRQAFPYYDPKAEIALIQKAIDADIYIVGVCLGAQLLSVAYGGKYEHSPEREIGVFPINLTEAGLDDEHIKRFWLYFRYRSLAWRYAWIIRQCSCYGYK